jgi:L,D-peptidoglycan transpeptidase YkuD (ErfK/YbiS/YcfS/YnhG family)
VTATKTPTEAIEKRPSPSRSVKPAFLISGAAAAAVLGAVGFVSARVDLTVPLSLVPANFSLLTVQLNGQTPEGQLIQTYQQLARGEESKAFATITRLAHAEPEFALAQLVYGDMLLARIGKPAQGLTEPEPHASVDAAATLQAERSASLRAEARLRLAALVERPPQDAVPLALLNLAPTVRHAIVVDASRARLYLFENGPGGMTLLRDSYVSLGKLGVGKQTEGDMRTPLGTYHVGLRRDEAADRYGAAALPLNYPNEYDRIVGRSGSSIWLHGERSGNYARGPQSTDGCIVLSNDDMRKLADTVEARETPILVVNGIAWVKKGAVKPSLDQGFEAAYSAWNQARLQQDATTLRGLYETGLQRGSDSETERLERNLARMSRQDLPVQTIERLSVLPGMDQQPVMIVTYRELSGLDPKPKLKRQYWRELGGHWRIFFDGLVS